MKKNYCMFLFFISTVYLTHTGGSISEKSSDIVEYRDHLTTAPATEQRVVNCPQNKSPYTQCQKCFNRAYIRSLIALRHKRKATSAQS